MKPVQILVVRVAAVLAGSAVIGAGIASNPATAQGANSLIQEFTNTVCSKSTACHKYTNNGSGAGVEGVGTSGNGVTALSTNGSATFSQSTNADGVQAYSNNNDGTNSGTNNPSASDFTGRSGVWGHDDSSDGGTLNVGVAGSSTNGSGVSGSSANNNGVTGTSTNGTGVAGLSSGGTGVYSSSSNRGSDLYGGYIGVIGRAPAGGGTFPMVLTDQVGNNLDFTNGNGDLYVHGTYNNFARVRGNIVVSYGATSTSPSIEDTGSGQLVNGMAIVNLDPTFAKSIDSRQAYHVMITPDGDTRGLYVASKGSGGFVVREVQGGRGTLGFDYHIYATKLGHANERMLEMTPGQAAAFMPKVLPITVHAPKMPKVH